MIHMLRNDKKKRKTHMTLEYFIHRNKRISHFQKITNRSQFTTHYSKI